MPAAGAPISSPSPRGLRRSPGRGYRLPGSSAFVALGDFAGELGLNRIPERMIDNRRVLARM